jgi:hypothetical protein
MTSCLIKIFLLQGDITGVTDDSWRDGSVVERNQYLLETGFGSDCILRVGVEEGECKV